MALISGTVATTTPPAATGEGVNKTVRGWKTGEIVTADIGQRMTLVAEGTYYKATNPTWGTGLALNGAATTTFTATNAALIIVNSSTTVPTGPYVYLDYIRLICTAAGTAGVSLDVGLIIDANTRYSSGGTTLTKYNCNSASAAAGIATVYAGNVTAAAAVSPRQMGRARLKTQAAPNVTIGDEFLLTFGTGSNTGQGATNGTTTIKVGTDFGPIALGPSAGGNHSFLLHAWATSQSAAPSFEYEVGWWER